MSVRPRGFTLWRPRTETRQLLDQAQAVLDEYRDHLPLTLRQIFYRLIGAHGYEKTERGSKRLGELLNKARRARLVDMSAIRNDGFTSHQPLFFQSAHHFFESVACWADQLRLDRQRRQKRRMILWCEASGMVPQLARVAEPFGIEICSSGGFDSVTDKYRVARLWAGSAVTVLHMGDHDPSGVHVFGSLAADIKAFAAGGDVEFIGLAVTPEQAALYSLPSAPAKPTDDRRFEGEETWQAEALDPRTVTDIVTAAIEGRIDRALYEAVIEEEQKATPGRAFTARARAMTASQATLRRGERVAWGPPTAPRGKITKWTAYRNSACTMLAFLSVQLRSGMVINDLKLMAGPNGRRRVAMPAKKQLDRVGKPWIDANGKAIFSQLVEFRDRATADRFQNQVLELVHTQHPECFGGGAP